MKIKFMIRPIVLCLTLIPTTIFAQQSKALDEKYDFFKPDGMLKELNYNNFLSNQPILNDEKENQEDFYNLNLYLFSNSGTTFNYRKLDFVNNYFSDKLYQESSLFMLFNTNDNISGQVRNLEQEENPIKRRIETEKLFNKIKLNYKNKLNYEEILIQPIFYNQINVNNKSEYIYEDKSIFIELGNTFETNTNISFFCSEDFTFAYTIGKNAEESKDIKSIADINRIYIALPENLINMLEPKAGNRCQFKKTFDTHEDAIVYSDVLNNPRNRFILEFQFNQEQNNKQFFYEAHATKFGLYNVKDNFMSIYDDFNINFTYEDTKKSVTNTIFETLKEKNHFSYKDNFDLENHFNTQVFYPTQIGYIRFDISNKTAYLYKENKYKVRYTISKENNNLYHLELKKVDYFNTFDLPEKIVLRKLYENFDLFVKYTYNFKSDILSITPDQATRINY